MSRTDKIQKLSNAIRRYRGLIFKDQFVHSPQPDAWGDVVRWLNRLGLPVSTTMQKIVAFKSTEEMAAWLKERFPQ